MADQINSFTHTHTHTHRHTHTHTYIHTHMFASIVITTPQSSIILCFVNENNELSINAKYPIFQCVKSVRIPSFSGRYVTALLGLNTEIYRIRTLFTDCFRSCKTIDCCQSAFGCLKSTIETQEQCQKSVQS